MAGWISSAWQVAKTAFGKATSGSPWYAGLGRSAASSAADWYLQMQANKASAKEAKNLRDWQEMMSNTAHQREMADLLAAGLNPMLSMGGGGASTPGGAMAQVNAPTPGRSFADAESRRALAKLQAQQGESVSSQIDLNDAYMRLATAQAAKEFSLKGEVEQRMQLAPYTVAIQLAELRDREANTANQARWTDQQIKESADRIKEGGYSWPARHWLGTDLLESGGRGIENVWNGVESWVRGGVRDLDITKSANSALDAFLKWSPGGTYGSEVMRSK